ncbi:hypothetical protein HGM15179_011794 [Zosterops borbonicus]|uniref:Reverse transcriptase domain-containing protein n=1 Tax=Zosterops borbonicus TaxID=364589 RepID=A0A8K1GBX0_9PASS|nr:hypothetical protein HGM15179_011794 [Zosterops borbonicus]
MENREDLGSYREVSLTLVPVEIMEQIHLESMLRHMENEEVLADSRHGFTKGKSCLTNLWVFCGRFTMMVDGGRALDILYPDLSKAFELPHMTSLSLKWRDIILMGGPVSG